MDWLYLLIGAVALITAIQNLAAIRRSTQNIEGMLQRLLKDSGVDWGVPTMPSEEVKALALDGQEIDAIRIYRQQTGTDLKAARKAVQQLRTAPTREA